MAYDLITLRNGLRIVGERMPDIRTAAVGVFVHTGAVNESPEENGYSHFVEHMVFKGTKEKNAAALAEYTMGAGKGRGSLLYVTVGTGIGGGLVIDGKVVHGLVHPEMGHMLLAPQEGDSMPDGVCPYHRHCLEGLASGPAIEKRWGLSAKLMTEDHPAWELEATYLAQMCVNMIVTVSPEVIVLGGGVMQQMHLFPQIRERVLKLLGGYVSSPSITPEGIDSYIVPPALGVNSGVIGALLLGAQALEKEGER